MSETKERQITPEIGKPSVLYHASQNRNVELFEPRAKSYRDRKEGPVVFGTPELPFATMFIVDSDDSQRKKCMSRAWLQ